MVVELSEALAVERAKRERETSEAYTKQELRKVVLGALLERLNESRRLKGASSRSTSAEWVLTGKSALERWMTKRAWC